MNEEFKRVLAERFKEVAKNEGCIIYYEVKKGGGPSLSLVGTAADLLTAIVSIVEHTDTGTDSETKIKLVTELLRNCLK